MLECRRRGQLKDQILIRFVSVMLGLMIGAAPAVAAVEQCRFIQAKPEREACYQRQAIALAAKRKPEPTADTRTLETLQQMRRDDDEVYKSLRSICRGCLTFIDPGSRCGGLAAPPPERLHNFTHYLPVA